MVATTEGDEDAAVILRTLLNQLRATGDRRTLVTVLRRLLAGERGEELLTGLDVVDAAIVRETLHRLTNGERPLTVDSDREFRQQP